MTRILQGIVASAVGVAVLLTTALPVQADELDDQRSELTSQMASQADAVDHASVELTAANAALVAARDELGIAERKLEAAEAARRDAQVQDDERAAELEAAEHKLNQAEADVAAAQAAFDSVDARTNEEIVVITQQNGPLFKLALLITDVSAAELNQRAQLSTTLFESSALELDELQSRRFALDAAKASADEAQAIAAEARQAAAEQLAISKEKEAAADILRDEVAQKVTVRDAAAGEASHQLELEETRQAALESESAEVDKRIADRVAGQKAAEEAARQKIEEEAAARRSASKAASRKAAASRSNAAKAKQSTPAKHATAARPHTVRRPAASISSGGFQRPVSGRLSSSYGMRLHPVLGIRKLHDGTDFAASCGAPIKAAAAGTVAERYYNGGYGNRLMIDHGQVNGKYVTTGYNHATRYVVSVGQRVSKGQVIGYVGSTGYSTGCHLHLMVWENGTMVNPMSKWFR